MSDERHPHFCDCDGCLNTGGGHKLDGAGLTRPATAAEKRRDRRSSMRDKSARFARLVAEQKAAFEVEIAEE